MKGEIDQNTSNRHSDSQVRNTSTARTLATNEILLWISRAENCQIKPLPGLAHVTGASSRC